MRHKIRCVNPDCQKIIAEKDDNLVISQGSVMIVCKVCKTENYLRPVPKDQPFGERVAYAKK